MGRKANMPIDILQRINAPADELVVEYIKTSMAHKAVSRAIAL